MLTTYNNSCSMIRKISSLKTFNDESHMIAHKL